MGQNFSSFFSGWSWFSCCYKGWWHSKIHEVSYLNKEDEEIWQWTMTSEFEIGHFEGSDRGLRSCEVSDRCLRSCFFKALEGILNTSQRRVFFKWDLDEQIAQSSSFLCFDNEHWGFFVPCLPVVKKTKIHSDHHLTPQVGLQEPSHEQLLIRCSWLPGWQVALVGLKSWIHHPCYRFLWPFEGQCPPFLGWESRWSLEGLVTSENPPSLGGLQQQCRCLWCSLWVRLWG